MNLVVGYYMTTAAGVIETASGEKADDLLLTCDDSAGFSCTTTVTNVVSSAGYYLNAALPDHLILCTQNANCQLKTGEDVKEKEFVGVGGKYIGCSDAPVCSIANGKKIQYFNYLCI